MWNRAEKIEGVDVVLPIVGAVRITAGSFVCLPSV